MAISTAAPTRTHRRWTSARTTAANSYAATVKMASEARHRYRRPSLVIGSFGCVDASAWVTFGLGAGLLAIGVSLFALEMLGGDE